MSAGMLALLLEAFALVLLGIRAWIPQLIGTSWSTARGVLYQASVAALVGALVLSLAAVSGNA